MGNFEYFDAGNEIFMHRGRRVQIRKYLEGTTVEVQDIDQGEVYQVDNHDLETADPDTDLWDA